MKTKTIAILGAGSWGTAVAVHLASHGNRVLLWGHHPEHVEDMKKQRVNKRYMPDIKFPASLTPVSNLEEAVTEAEQTIVAVPSHAFAEVLTKLKKPPRGLSWLTKGLDPKTNRLLSQLVAEKWGKDYPVAVIAGPSFAGEVARHLPTALTIASHDIALQNDLRSLFHHGNIRIYLSDDIVGVQLCGAVKNVLAIACGISDGLGYGANAKAALITRGLAEMTRLGTTINARPETFMGLAGVGDLVLTCTDDQSRNRRFGLQVGRGMSISESEKHIGQVVEGKHNAAQVCALAKEYQVDMPICMEVNHLLLEKVDAKQAAVNLMTRPPRDDESF